MKLNKEIVIVAGARTAFGKFGGTLKDFSAIQLGVFAAQETIKRAGVKPEDVDHVVFGNASQGSPLLSMACWKA